MDINQSTADGQSEIIEGLFHQANVGDPTDTPGVVDITDQVVMFHGDLGTSERITSARQSRSIEQKAIRRLQFVVFVPGLFHLLMACADSLHRMYIEPSNLRADPNGLYQQACKIRPLDSGRIGTKPGFRLMHELILQCTTARMVDIFRVEVGNRHLGDSLAGFAATKPQWEDIVKLSIDIATTYLDKPTSSDAEFRNNSLILARLLQYVELHHAMRHGDIGRVEATFLHWTFVFKSVGKHKYATQLVRTLIDLRYVYPERLA